MGAPRRRPGRSPSDVDPSSAHGLTCSRHVRSTRAVRHRAAAEYNTRASGDQPGQSRRPGTTPAKRGTKAPGRRMSTATRTLPYENPAVMHTENQTANRGHCDAHAIDGRIGPNERRIETAHNGSRVPVYSGQARRRQLKGAGNAGSVRGEVDTTTNRNTATVQGADGFMLSYNRGRESNWTVLWLLWPHTSTHYQQSGRWRNGSHSMILPWRVGRRRTNR